MIKGSIQEEDITIINIKCAFLRKLLNLIKINSLLGKIFFR